MAMEEQKEFRGVIFDCVGVLLKDGQKAALPDLATLIGVETDAIEQALGGEARHLYTMNKLAPQDYWNYVLQQNLGVDILKIRRTIAEQKGESLETIGMEAVAGELESIILKKYEPIQETVSLIQKLKSGGYWVGMISNTTAPRANYWLTTFENIWSMFDNVVFSFNNSPQPARKPEGTPSLINSLLGNVGYKAGELVYIDDKMENVEAAINSGVGGAIQLATSGQQPLHSPRLIGNGGKVVVASVDRLEATLKENYHFVF